MFLRPISKVLMSRLNEKRRFIQVLIGPRQTGKTTIARQILDKVNLPSHYASADEPQLRDRVWIEQQWETARAKLDNLETQTSILVLDEVQKVPGWSETAKRLWDEDSNEGRQLHVVILGSSQLLMQQGLTESLAGRFEIIPVTHWSFTEMRGAFGWDVDRYLFFGGYPGAADLIEDQERWRRYIIDFLIETTVSRDVLLMKRVDKPALLRRLFELACVYSGQILSYQKMIGQLQDAGNTTTLANYLNLLEGAGLVMGLQKYAGQQARRKSSSPKLLVLNTALMSALSGLTFEEAKIKPDFWGRIVESSVGATLANGIRGQRLGLFYWSSRNREVDYVLTKGETIVAIEVKSGRKKTSLPGIEAFSREVSVKRKLLVGSRGIPFEEFLDSPVQRWIG
ncbi:MAG: ATP-binding protein [Deltaproteobacteria bacterium]|nr:ATP-binding protein [Deltaproteobacteria bacterium]